MSKYAIRNTFIHLEKRSSARRSKSCEVPRKDTPCGDDSCSENGAEIKARRGRRLSSSPRKTTTGSAPSDVNARFDGGYSVVMTLVRSLGSLGHTDKQCRPCIFYYGKGCSRGIECMYCHDCPPPKGSLQTQQQLVGLGNEFSGPKAHFMQDTGGIQEPYLGRFDSNALPFSFGLPDMGDFHGNGHLWLSPPTDLSFNDSPMCHDPFSCVRR